jgi:hypothetical protein
MVDRDGQDIDWSVSEPGKWDPVKVFLTEDEEQHRL